MYKSIMLLFTVFATLLTNLYSMEPAAQSKGSLSVLSELSSLIVLDNSEGLQELIDQGLPLHENITPDPVVLAVRHNSNNVLRILLAANVNFQEEHSGNLPLEEALMGGNFVGADMLVDVTFKNGTITKAEEVFCRVLEKMLILEDEEATIFLLQKMRQYFLPQHTINILNHKLVKARPLEIAICGNNYEQAELLLKHGAQFKYCFIESGSTALLEAIDENDTKMVTLILENGANPNPVLSDDKSPLMAAVHKNNPEMVKQLLWYGAQVNFVYYLNGDCYSPLGYALINSMLEIINLLLDAGADWSTHCKFGQIQGSCFELCPAYIQPIVMTKLLLRYMLKNAIDHGDGIMVQKIIIYTSPAVVGGNQLVELVQDFLYKNQQLLCDLGLPINNDLIAYIQNREQNRITTRGLAKNSNLTSAFYYMSTSIPLTSKFENGDTLLHKAVCDNKLEHVRLLLSFGAWPLGVKNNDGQTAYALAQAFNYAEIIQEMAQAL